jgi:UDP-N-acetylglucosamine 2-epimerase (non-hydrolysing)
MTFKTLCIVGTRPEAIKMAPLIQKLKDNQYIENKVCLTGQHKQMLDATVEHFAIPSDFNLEVMSEAQNLSDLTAKILTQLEALYSDYRPHLILVHGDTTTTLSAALSAYYHQIPIAHVEAGLRTGNINSPWPEEGNRKLLGTLATLHFAPTPLAKKNLEQEGVPAHAIHVTGNTIIDSLLEMMARLETNPQLKLHLEQEFHYLNTSRKLVLVTGHRRENFGEGFENICRALACIAQAHPDIDIVYPVHLNPQVQQPVKSYLGFIKNIYLIPPVNYLSFLYLMKRAYVILTDSGGVQEEALFLGKPLLIMREITERSEVIDAKAGILVGTNSDKIINHLQALLADKALYLTMSQPNNYYGDGEAAERITKIILKWFYGENMTSISGLI